MEYATNTIRIPDTPAGWHGLQEQSLIDGERYTLTILFLDRYSPDSFDDFCSSAEVAIFNDGGAVTLSPYSDSSDDFCGDDGMYRAPASRILRAIEMFRKAQDHADILKVLAGLVPKV